MSMKKTLVAAAILAVSGSAIAATPDVTTLTGEEWASVKNLQWVGTLTPQTANGPVVITDEYDRRIESGKTFPIGTVDDTDLTFDYNFGAPAILKFQMYDDANGNSVYDDGVSDPTVTAEDVALIPNAGWTINNFAYKSRSASLETTHDGEYTVRIDGKASALYPVAVGGAIDNTQAATDLGGEVKVMIEGKSILTADGTAAFTADPAKPVESVVAYVSLTADVM